MSHVETRLAELEREVKGCRRSAFRDRLVIGGLVALVAFLVIGATGQPAKVVDELRLKKMQIVDEKGATRIGLGTSEEGSPILAVFDEKGQHRIALSISDDGSTTMSLHDEKGTRRAQLGLSKDGTPNLGLCNQKGDTRWMLAMKADGTTGLDAYDEKGTIRVELALSKDGTPKLSFWDEKGMARAILGAADMESPDGTKTTYPESTLILLGPDGKQLWKTPH